MLCHGNGTDDAEFVVHDLKCVFFDGSVDRVKIKGLKRLGDPTICHGCEIEWDKCPAHLLDSGWALAEHTRLIVLCERYRNELEKRALQS